MCVILAIKHHSSITRTINFQKLEKRKKLEQMISKIRYVCKQDDNFLYFKALNGLYLE